ncbi:MAG: gliding motility-associated C-terminal domain-containing protein [Bacteroidota bacterium]
MRHTLSLFFFIIALFTSNIKITAQNVAACNATRVICPTPAFTFTSTSGNGLTGGLGVSNPVPNPYPTSTGGPANGGCLFNLGANPEWLVINVTTSGNLGWTLGQIGSANPQTSFMHWAMWLYDANTCTNIFNNTQAPVSCNHNSNASGGTGMGPIPGGGFAGNYQATIPVTAGQQYLLLVSNVAGVVNNVSFTNNGTAGISCNPLIVPNATACPNQPTVVTANWSGAATQNYTIIPSANATVYPAFGGGPVPQTSPNFTIVGSTAPQVTFTVLASGTNGAGQPITATQYFTLTVNPTATLDVLGANFTPPSTFNYCTGANPTFTFAGGTGTFCLLAGAPGVNAQCVTTNTMILPNTGLGFQSPNNLGVYTFSANYNTGCSATKTIQINVAPDNFITICSTNPMDICQGGVACLCANMPTAFNYSWTGPAWPAASGGTIHSNPCIANIQPSHAGIYTVVANINYNGITCARQSTAQVRVVQTYSVDVGVGTYTFCQGTPACITASAVGTNTNSFNWNGPGFNSFVQSPCITNSMTPANVGAYGVTAAFSNGFLTCYRASVVNVLMVSVIPPTVVLPNLICQYGTANMLISAPVSGGSSVQSYSWSGPPSAAITGTNPTMNIQNVQPQIHSGIYCGSVVYAIGTRTCPASDCKPMNVVPVNSIAVAPAGGAVACYPNSVSLFANAITATSYSWSGPNSYTANTANTTLYYPPVTASGIYTVFVSYNNGGITCNNTNTISVSINPVMSFTLPEFIRGCYNETLSIPGPVGATSYSWTSTTGFSSNSPTLTLATLQPTQSGIYQLNVSLGPCQSSRQLELDVLSPIQFTLTPQGREVCLRDTVLLEVGAAGGSENYAYDWNPANYLNAPTGNVVTGIMLGTTVFNVSARDIACPQYTISNAFTVLVKMPPQPDLRLDKNEGCEPLRIFFNTRTQATASITTFDFGGFNQFQRDSFEYPFNEPGIYTVRITSHGTNGCTGLYELPYPIIVHPRLKSDIQWSPDVPTTTDNLVTFNPVSQYTDAATYYWMFSGTGLGDNDSSLVKNPQRKYEETGKFPVMLVETSEFGCIDTVITFIEIRDDLNLYVPNSFTPNGDGINDFFYVKGLGFKSENFFLDVYDRWSHLVFSSRDISNGWDGTVKGGAPVQGTYIYKVRIVGQNGEGRKEYIGHVTLIK